jgi:hypothetical protein
MHDTQIYSETGYTIGQKFYAIYSYAHQFKEGQINCKGEKYRISDDNSLKNKIELTTKKVENDDELCVL